MKYKVTVEIEFFTEIEEEAKKIAHDLYKNYEQIATDLYKNHEQGEQIATDLYKNHEQGEVKLKVKVEEKTTWKLVSWKLSE